MASNLGYGLYHDSSIPRPRSAMYFREARDWQPPRYDPNQNLALPPYATAPEPYHNTQGGLAASFYQDPNATHIQYERAPTTDAYLDPCNYPGDLATSHELVERDRNILTDIAKAKIPINPVLKPIYDAGKTAVETVVKAAVILASPYIGVYITDVYLKPMENQINQSGRARNIPAWLKNFARSHYSNINLDSVRYGEDIQMATIKPGTAMTIGYDIYFPMRIDLELANFPTDWDGQLDRLRWFARCVFWIMHEMEHTVQFYKAGGDKHLWVIKYVAQTGVFMKLGPSDDSHDAIQLEKDADNKSWSLYTEALKYFSRNRPTIPRTLYSVASLGPHLGISDGDGLKSEDGRFVFRVQSDGNMVIYAPDNLVIWQSETAGKACPPFWLVSSPEKDAFMLKGYTFRVPSVEPIETIIWRTSPYRVPEVPGAYYLVDPTWSLILQSSAFELILTNAGQLQSRLTFDDGRPPVVMRTTGSHPITTQVIESTTTTLPAAHPSSSFAYNPGVIY